MPPGYASISAEFRDLDAYVASLTGADFRYTMTHPGVSLWKLDRVFLPGGLVVQSIRGGCGSILESGTPDVSINLFLHREGYFQVLGQELDLATAVLMPPGSESFSRTPGKYSCFGISIPRRFVRTSRALRALDGDNIRKARIIRARSAKRDSVRPLLARFFSNIAMNPEILASPALLTGFRDELVMVLGREYGGQSESPPPRRGRISKVDAIVISRAVEAIEAFDGPSMPMDDLANAVGVPERTLRAGFNRYLGLSPKKYMQLRTMHSARSRLAIGSSEDTTVARVAMDLGSWDLGRFAMRYRTLFGEPPSATLHRP
jgi:AraC family ethanolamine operon transcriptional activator